ncbi:cytochrome P450 [Nemania abortiva]|nr:cytochrome P450 [Nemania abortiva]
MSYLLETVLYLTYHYRHLCTTLCAIVLCLSVYGVRQWFLPKPLPGIPYNEEATRSIWGDSVELRGDPSGLARWCSKQLAKHGSPITQALMGPFETPIVLVGDTAQVREKLMGHSDFDRSVYIIDRFPLFGEFHLNMLTGDAWRTSRGWLKDLLAPHYLHDVIGPLMARTTDKLIELWELKSQKTDVGVFSVRSDIKTYALDIIVGFHFGDDFPDSALDRQIDYVKRLKKTELQANVDGDIEFLCAPMHEFQEGVTEVGDRMGRIYTTRWPPTLVAWYTKYVSPFYRKYLASKDVFIRRHIDTAVGRLRNGQAPKTGVDYMIMREDKLARKAGRTNVLGKQIVIDEAYGNLIAGQHTTSAALVWVVKYLSENPKVQETLREELQSVCIEAVREGRLPTAAEIINNKLPYLDAVIEETLRLRAAMLVPRDATCDTEPLGRHIPKGTRVLLVCQGPNYFPSMAPSQYWNTEHKAPGHFPGGWDNDLNSFRPERWLVAEESSIRKGPNGEHAVQFDGSTYPQLAFGLGIRACWGRRLAMLEQRIFTSMMVWKFDFLEVPKALSTHEASYDISYRAKHGYVRVKSRWNRQPVRDSERMG